MNPALNRGTHLYGAVTSTRARYRFRMPTAPSFSGAEAAEVSQPPKPTASAIRAMFRASCGSSLCCGGGSNSAGRRMAALMASSTRRFFAAFYNKTYLEKKKKQRVVVERWGRQKKSMRSERPTTSSHLLCCACVAGGLRHLYETVFSTQLSQENGTNFIDASESTAWTKRTS